MDTKMTVELIESRTMSLGIERAKSLQSEIIWQKMRGLPLSLAVEGWLETLAERTRINYRSGLHKLEEAGIINLDVSMQAFSLVNHDASVDSIKQLPVKETTRQARAALYISLTRYLSRRFRGVIAKAMPCREGSAKTFFRVHEKITTSAMDLKQWTEFFIELEKINSRDCLIGKIVLQGAKRIREVLGLHIEQIDWQKREITFSQSKTRGMVKQTVITYPESIMQQLRDLIGDRTDGHVFLSRKGNPITLNQLANTFAKAGVSAGIPFKITPHVLRASAVTYLKQQGFADSDIIKITGHASGEMVRAYDKSERADNPTKRVNLVG